MMFSESFVPFLSSDKILHRQLSTKHRTHIIFTHLFHIMKIIKVLTQQCERNAGAGLCLFLFHYLIFVNINFCYYDFLQSKNYIVCNIFVVIEILNRVFSVIVVLREKPSFLWVHSQTFKEF